MMYRMIILCLLANEVVGMQDKLAIIERDCQAIQRYIVQVLNSTGHEISPFAVLESLTKPDALVNKNVHCEYFKPSEYVQEILKKHRIRMGRDYEKQKSVLGSNSSELLSWFTGYIKETIVPRAIEDLKKEHAVDSLYKTYSSSGV